MFYVGGYLLLCLAVSFWSWQHIRESFEEQVQEDPRIAILAWLVTAIVSPICLPVCWMQIIFEDWRYRRKLRQHLRRYLDPEMTRVNFFQLDAATRDWFQRANDTMLRLGFELVGDFQYRTEPVHLVDRVFLSADRQVLGTAVMANGEPCIEMQSLDETSTVITSSSVDQKLFPELPVSSDLYVVNFVSGGTIEELYERHHQLLVERGQRLYRLALNNCWEMLVFGARRFGQWRFRLGEKTEQPPEPVMPTGCELAPIERIACSRAVHLSEPPAGSAILGVAGDVAV